MKDYELFKVSIELMIASALIMVSVVLFATGLDKLSDKTK
jgi:hypothetical protein